MMIIFHHRIPKLLSIFTLLVASTAQHAGAASAAVHQQWNHADRGRDLAADATSTTFIVTFADETIAYLQEKHSAPFFAYLAFDGPHDPHIVPDDYPVRYDPEEIPLPPISSRNIRSTTAR